MNDEPHIGDDGWETLEAISAEIDTGFVVRPGDILILTTMTNMITAEQAHNLRTQVLTQLPQLADVVILSGLSVQAVFREEPKE